MRERNSHTLRTVVGDCPFPPSKEKTISKNMSKSEDAPSRYKIQVRRSIGLDSGEPEGYTREEHDHVTIKYQSDNYHCPSRKPHRCKSQEHQTQRGWLRRKERYYQHVHRRNLREWTSRQLTKKIDE